jgi:putative transposase
VRGKIRCACESLPLPSVHIENHGELKTQLEAACKLYNALLHAEQEEYERNKRTMSKNELRQLALDLRKQNPEFQVLHSQVAQQVADRFYEARQRFFEGLANKPKKKKPHRYLSLVYPQSGWRLCDVREVGLGKNKKRKARLRLSKIGFFTLILHRELPLEQVSQVCVKLYPSGRIHVIFLVEEAEAEEQQSENPKKAVGVDLGITRLVTLSPMGASWRTRGRLSALLKESGCFKGHYQEKGFSQRTGLKRR